MKEMLLQLWASYGPILAILLAVIFWAYNRLRPAAAARPRPAPAATAAAARGLAGSAGTSTRGGAREAEGAVRRRHRAAGGDKAEPRGWAAATTAPAAAAATARRDGGGNSDAAAAASSGGAVKIKAVTLDNPSALEWQETPDGAFASIGPRAVCSKPHPSGLTLRYRGNVMRFVGSGTSKVTVNVNGVEIGEFPNPTSLGLKRMALCVGDDVCVAWPPLPKPASPPTSPPPATTTADAPRAGKPAQTPESAKAKETRSEGGEASTATGVRLSAVSVDNPSALEWQQTPTDPFRGTSPREICKGALGPSVTLRYRGNVIVLVATGADKLSAVINGKPMGSFSNPTSLSLKKMAVCIGDDLCVMWPPKQQESSPSPKETPASAATTTTTAAAAAAAAPKSAPAQPKAQKAAVGGATAGQSSPCFLEAMTPTVLDSEGRSVPTESLRGRVIGLYFSAHWCGPCRQFTPFLTSWLAEFQQLHPKGTKFAVVFVSRDHGAAEFAQYRAEMNFAALPFDVAQAQGSGLAAKYGVQGIPALVVVQSDGTVITSEGRREVSTDYDPPGQRFPWSPLPLGFLCGDAPANPRVTPGGPSGGPPNASPGADAVGKVHTATVSRTASSRKLPPPTTAPLSSPQAVERWAPGSDPCSVASVPRRPRRADPSAPRLVVCHDMMGGYTPQDKHPQGATGDADIYRIYHWHLIDTFIYFSHNLVSIPTPGWTNAAHRNGVQVLGTFITEWEAGQVACTKIFENINSANAFAAKLVDIAKYYGFDGWLVNIENPLGQAKVPILKHFLRSLTDKMHNAVPESTILWYDAVTTEGTLQHQNALTSKNKPFFDATDGIFLNYWWDPQALQRSRVAAGPRSKAVYAGIDVFGRNTYGGGGMKCGVATEAIKAAGVSAALFAPGWVFEDAQFDKKHFDANSAKFWAQFEDGTFRRNPLAGLPLATTFCAGAGELFAVQGEVVRQNAPWASLSEQGIMVTEVQKPKLNPYFPVLKDNANAADTFGFQPVRLNYTRAYDGGSSLAIRGAARVTPKTLEREDRAVFKLLATELPLSSPVCVCFSFSINYKGAPAGPVAPSLVLVCLTPTGSYQYLTLHCHPPTAPPPLEATAEEAELAGKLEAKYGMAPSRCAARTPDKAVYLETAAAGPIGQPDANGWHTAAFVLCDKQLKVLTVREVRLSLGVAGPPAESPQPVAVDVGAVRIFKTPSAIVPNVVGAIRLGSESLTKDAAMRWRLGGLLQWEVTDPHKAAFFEIWRKVGDGWAYVGRSHSPWFHLDNVTAESPDDMEMCFTVQPCNAALCRLPLAACTTLVVKLS